MEKRVQLSIKNGLVFDYTHLTGKDGISTAKIKKFLPRMKEADAAVKKIFETGFSRGHLSKDGTPEHVFFPRQAYLKKGNPNTAASIERLIATGEKWRKDHVDVAVFIGIGGSYLGDKVIFDLAAGPYWNLMGEKERGGRCEIYFAGNNVDGAALSSLMDYLKYKAKTLKRKVSLMLVPISKSGTTMEPLSAFASLMDFGKKNGRYFKVSVTAVTGPDKNESLLRRLAEENGWDTFDIPEGIGGRFCVLSDPGLLMAAAAGYDIKALLKGAKEMSELCLKSDPMENPALMNAALKYLAAKDLGAEIEVFMGYGDAIRSLGDWYVQLLAESLGKKKDRDGNEVCYGRTPIVAGGTTDMHSMTQQHQDGRRNKIIQFLEIAKPVRELLVNNPFKKEKAFDIYTGRNMDELLKAALGANETALAGDRRLSARYILPELSPRYVGQLFMFLMYSIAYEGEMADVDAFDQPGVEAYKKIMKADLAKKK